VLGGRNGVRIPAEGDEPNFALERVRLNYQTVAGREERGGGDKGPKRARTYGESALEEGQREGYKRDSSEEKKRRRDFPCELQKKAVRSTKDWREKSA